MNCVYYDGTKCKLKGANPIFVYTPTKEEIDKCFAFGKEIAQRVKS